MTTSDSYRAVFGPQTPQSRRRDDARIKVESTMWRLTADDLERESGITDHDVFAHTVPLYPGTRSTRRTLRPEYALTAARDVLFAAREQLNRALIDARGSGMSWEAISTQLGLDKAAEEAEMPPARAAWRLAAMGVFPDEEDKVGHYGRNYGISARWRCWTCHGSIVEVDLDNGVDAQRGHAADCTRFATELETDRRRWDDED